MFLLISWTMLESFAWLMVSVSFRIRILISLCLSIKDPEIIISFPCGFRLTYPTPMGFPILTFEASSEAFWHLLCLGEGEGESPKSHWLQRKEEKEKRRHSVTCQIYIYIYELESDGLLQSDSEEEDLRVELD